MVVNELTLKTMPLGVPPSDWDAVYLGDVTLKIGSGETPRGGAKVYQSQGMPFIRSQNVHDHEFRMNGLVYVDEVAAEKLRRVAVEQGDVLLNITGEAIARCCVAPASVLPARVNQHVAIVRPNPERLDSVFL